ncbi:hypothetical protein [Phocaeicola plebeius]|uniref:hypothetical protein n=1 Tax=Phocaeicola plebeius TaxID=310297 RepID=UPI0026EFDEFA|nr:hypothetical protein [Phocaeicola plebeius]
MKNRFYHLLGAALITSLVGLSSCSDFEEVPSGGNGNGQTEITGLDLNGEYEDDDDDYKLELTYNGSSMKGKKVTVQVNEDYTSAYLILSGKEVDLSNLVENLMAIRFTSMSPIPGEKEIGLTVDLTPSEDGKSYTFAGSSTSPTGTVVSCSGTMAESSLKIDVTAQFAGELYNTLAGTWNLSAANTSVGDITTFTPLWLDWKSEVDLGLPVVKALGIIKIIDLSGKPNKALTELMKGLGKILSFELNIYPEVIIGNLLKSAIAYPDGCMRFIYSYSGDLNNPAWCGEDGMERNTVHYYQDMENPAIVRLVVNPDVLVNLDLSSLLGGTSSSVQNVVAPLAVNDVSRSETPLYETADDIREPAQDLIDVLIPALEKGFPCTYTLEDGKLKFQLESTFTAQFLQKLSILANHPDAVAEIDNTLHKWIDSDMAAQITEYTKLDIFEEVHKFLPKFRDAAHWADEALTIPLENVDLGFMFEKESNAEESFTE